MRSGVRLGVALLLAAALLSWAALWNGYPLMFYDSGDYAGLWDKGWIEPYRLPVYGLLITPLHWGRSLWGVVAGQALLTAWMLREGVAAFGPARNHEAWLVAMTAILAAATSLPWYAGQVMPDILAGLMLLGLAVLMAGRETPPLRRLVVAAVVALAAAAHFSHLLLAIGIVAAVGLLRRRLPPRRVVAPILAALMIVPAANAAMGRGFVYSETGPVFLLGRLIQDGFAKSYLDRHCPAQPDSNTPLGLCAFKDRLPVSANDFLWGRDPAFQAIGGWRNGQDEARRVVLGSLRQQPLDHLAAALADTMRQAVMIRTGDGIAPQREPWGVVERSFPADFPAYRAARQQNGALSFDGLNRWHRPLAFAAIGLLALALPQLGRIGRPEAVFCAVILGGLFGNAALCATLSNPDDRYQSRIVWLAVYGGMILAANWVTQRRSARRSAASAAPTAGR